MCLAVPGKIVEWREHDSPFASALVEFGGIRRSVNMACMTDVGVGDYVLVHAGIAISRIDPDEAARVWAALEQIDFDEMELSGRSDTVRDED